MGNPQSMPDLFSQTKQAWLEGARSVARKLLNNRYQITIDDVTKEYPLPKYLHKNIIGGVFQNEMFEAIGYTKSRRLVAHGRVVRIWTLNDKYRNQTELDCEG